MPAYLVHHSRERVRIRHQALSNPQAQARVFGFLREKTGIAGIRPGRNSLLLLLEPSANIALLCRELEAAFPFLRETRPCLQPMHRRGRQCRLLVLLAAGVATVGLSMTGLKRVHAVAGSVFTLLAMEHVWKRRTSL